MIGRTHELDSVARHLDAGGAVCLEGDAGIGKTTVWRAGVELARERGFRVLVAEPVEAERSLSYSALADLLESVADDVLPSLPEPQRRALERVLLLAAEVGPLDARLVGAAVRTTFESLGGPALVAVDDVQWLDAASAAALAFALRRSATTRALFALRAGYEFPFTSELETLPVGPLSVGALHHLLVDRLGLALRRTPLLRLHEVAGGNPFYALELARANPDGGELVLPPSLQHLVADRVRALPPETRRALAGLALGGDGDGDGLTAAVEAGIVEETGGRFRFAHPLFAEAAAALLPEVERRALHAAIAGRSSDPEQRARHLAHAAAGPDESVASALAAAAEAATHRGAFAAAAELWELAAQLSPVEEDRLERLVEAGIAHVVAGNPEAGGALLEPNLERLPPGSLRQRGLVHLALRLARGDAHAAVSLLERARAEVEEPRLRYEVALLLARFLDRIDESRRADEIVLEHVRFAEEHGDPVLLEDALLLAAARRLFSDRPAWDLLDRARELAAARDDRPRRAWGWAPMTAAYLRDGRIDDARAALEDARSEAVRVGTADYDQGLLLNRSIVELAAGNPRLAQALADEALTIAEQIDDPGLVSFALMCVIFPLALLGEVDEAQRLGEQALELARRVGAVAAANGVFFALGLLELSRGRAGAAADLYREVTPSGLAGFNDVSGGRGALDAVEAFAAAGELERAVELAVGLPDDAHEKPLAEACVDAARGELAHAIELVEAVEPSPAPFRRAREQLLLGTLLRRARRKREARAALEAARAGFLALEAPLWAERAAEELARLGGRRPAGVTLTESERRVAELVASGVSNKEVAARLVVSVRTVEAHLSKVYEKLGVDSRAALAAHWAKTVDLRNTR